eukprot:scaffold272_cov381-Prasinococcus_capsulatus_cf.AAC.2
MQEHLSIIAQSSKQPRVLATPGYAIYTVFILLILLHHRRVPIPSKGLWTPRGSRACRGSVTVGGSLRVKCGVS